MKKWISLVSALCLLLLMAGCSATEPIPIANISDETIQLSKPISVSFTLGANGEMRMPFNLSIDKTAIKVKYDGKHAGQFSVALYISSSETEAAIFEINDNQRTATFTNLVSSEDYYIVIQNQRAEKSNLILEFSEHYS